MVILLAWESGYVRLFWSKAKVGTIWKKKHGKENFTVSTSFSRNFFLPIQISSLYICQNFLFRNE